MAIGAKLRAALLWGDEERAELTDEFLDHKVFTYVETLVDLATEVGVDLTDDDVHLSDEILRELRAEAVEHAGFVVDTFNKDAEKFLTENDALAGDDLFNAYEDWVVERGAARAEMIAVTEAYSASADATLAFYQANFDGDPEFDFGGHPDEGDEPAECPVCIALEETSPHPASRVLEVGSPHIGCRQDWHPAGLELPDEIVMPEKTAGIVGKQALVTRTGDHDSAVAEILGLAGVEPPEPG